MRIVLRYFLNIVRLILRLLPDKSRQWLRRQHVFMEVYSRALFESRMFFGSPSPKKEALRYKRLLANQSKKLSSLVIFSDTPQIDVVILVEECGCSFQSLLDMLGATEHVKSIYLYAASSKPFKDLCSFHPKIKGSVSFLDGDWPVLLIRSQEQLNDYAIQTFLHFGVEEYLNDKIPTIISCDTDTLDDKKTPHSPRCCPQWNPDLQLSTAYLETGLLVIGDSLIDDLKLFLQCYEGSYSYALWLCKLYLQDAKFSAKHLHFSLVHRKSKESDSWFKALARYQESTSSPLIRVLNNHEKDGQAIIRWQNKTPPLVSIIIPTYNAKALVKTCIESILQKSTFQNFEIILVDNNSDEVDALQYFDALERSDNRIRLLKYPKPFNYSAINNFATQFAIGEVYAFVNNDVEVIEPQWLEYMVDHVMREDIGCVGAKLLYPNQRVQHAGVVIGYGGGAGHAHKFYPNYHSGYMNRLSSTNNFSAVTAACMLVSKTDFEIVGGFDEDNLQVAFNDVDFCLEVIKIGKRNLYCAEAVLYHHESVSRGSENTPEKRQRFESEVAYIQSKWSEFIEADPCYSPNLTKHHENFALKE